MVEQKFPNSIQADPSKMSLRSEGFRKLKPAGIQVAYSIPLEEPKEIPIFVDESSGERFIEITRDIERQRFIVLLLKGVINVSDIIEVNGKYYSHVQDFDNLQPSQETREDIVAEAKADTIILRLVFSDWDHTYWDPKSGPRVRIENKQKRHPGSVIHHPNLFVDEAGRKINLFDFNRAAVYLNNFEPEALKARFRELMSDLYRLPNKSKELDIIKKKCQALLDLNSDFEIFKSKVEKSGMKLDEEMQKSVYDSVKVRLQVLSELVDDISK